MIFHHHASIWLISLVAVHPLIWSTVRSDPRCARQKCKKAARGVRFKSGLVVFVILSDIMKHVTNFNQNTFMINIRIYIYIYSNDKRILIKTCDMSRGRGWFTRLGKLLFVATLKTAVHHIYIMDRDCQRCHKEQLAQSSESPPTPRHLVLLYETLHKIWISCRFCDMFMQYLSYIYF